MKKTLFLLLLISFQTLGQSLLLTPNNIAKQSNSGLDDLMMTKYNGQTPYTIGRTANGTMSAPTAVNVGNLLNLIGGRGYNGTNFTTTSSAAITFEATQDWTNTANGASIVFETIPNNSTTRFTRMTINHDGKVGIGSTAPNLNADERMDIQDRLRIRRGLSTAGVWFNNSANSINIGDGAFHGMLNDNNTGIFIGGAWRFWVNNTGQVTSTALSGTGNRPVLADANGALIAEPSAQTLILQPTDFHPLVWSSSLSRFETSVSFTTIGGLVAPIKLPVGAKINSITLRAKDNLNTGKILYSLEKMSTSTNIPSQLSTGSSTIAEANASAINYVFTNSLPVTIQANNYYYITVNVYNSVDQITIPWNSGTNFFLGWIEIQYTF